MTIQIPELSLVVLIGASGSGKSTFARKHFLPIEILSSDFFRGIVSNDENSQTASKDAFETLYFILEKRLRTGLLTVVDATNVTAEARKPLLQMSKRYHVPAVALVLLLPERVCLQRNRQRTERDVGFFVVRYHCQQLQRSLSELEHEGFHSVIVLEGEQQIAEAVIERSPLPSDKRREHGPLDIIGDVHGCCDELEALLGKLGYKQKRNGSSNNKRGTQSFHYHPEGRRAVFVGDLVDRGPRVLDSIRLAIAMVEAGQAYCLPGNHDLKLVRKLKGRNVQVKHGLASSLAEIESLPPPEGKHMIERIVAFFEALPSHYQFDGGKLTVAHAGMKESMQGRMSRAVMDFALYGETTGETDQFGLPVRYNWAEDYRGKARVIYGHTPVPKPEWLNRTINIDTGCVFGGALTALRYPELKLVSVKAKYTYYESPKPFLTTAELSPRRG